MGAESGEVMFEESPEATIIFLFTDIEGSTKLWEAMPSQMRQALARHDKLVTEALLGHHGQVFKKVGDAFCAVFPTVSDALNGAIEAQLKMADFAVGDRDLKVRMAVHAGTAELRDGDYFGQPLNRIARLLSTGHGGQILLSQVAYDLCRDELPPGVALIPLGDHRLKDLARPETVYQVRQAQLSPTFPPLRSLDNPSFPNNLPQQVTSFVGRERDVAAVVSLLDSARLVTLTGSGGCGKTRLGLQIAADMIESFDDGVWFVELALLTDPAQVPQTAVGVLHVAESPGRSLTEVVTNDLAEKNLLLLIDNCEHVIEAVASLADSILRSCPNVRLLLTSREQLGISGERAYPVPALSLPERGAHVVSSSLHQYESVRLFIDRAIAVSPSFQVTNENAPAVAAICYRLDGIPLAVELAAARVRAMSVEQIDSRLDDALRLLTGGSRTSPARQQTLNALVDWSYNLLTEPERSLLARLSIFSGGADLDEVESICSGSLVDTVDVVDLLMGLVDKSLVVYGGSDAERYTMLQTIHQYARRRLEASGELEMIADRHLSYFVEFAERAAPVFRNFDRPILLEQLDRAQDNVRAAMTHALMSLQGVESGLRLCASAGRYWSDRGNLSEGCEWCRQALERPGAEFRGSARALALFSVARLTLVQGDTDAAIAFCEESLAIGREVGDEMVIASNLIILGNSALATANFRLAKSHYECALEVATRIGYRMLEGMLWGNTAIVAYEQGDFERATMLLERAVAFSREMGDSTSLGNQIANLGIVAFRLGDYDRARALHEQALAISRKLGNRARDGVNLGNLGAVACAQGQYEEARAMIGEALEISRETDSRVRESICLDNLGVVALAEGDFEVARAMLGAAIGLCRVQADRLRIAELLGLVARLSDDGLDPKSAVQLLAAEANLRDELSAPSPPRVERESAAHQSGLREVLGHKRFEAAWMEGTQMTLDQAVAIALGACGV